MTRQKKLLFGVLFAVALTPAAMWADTCTGACGILGANGVVTAPPSGSGQYRYITTGGGVGGAGQISGVGGTNGSKYISNAFTGNAGDILEFYFNYVTSDGAGFSDYGWAALVDSASTTYLFTARTNQALGGDTSPGFGLPLNAATLVPATTAINAGGPAWSPLGTDSGNCFDIGCGYTGWIKSTYELTSNGTYTLQFGVTNNLDYIWDSGLAWDGAMVGGNPINPVPEPSELSQLLALGTGFAFMVRKLRRA